MGGVYGLALGSAFFGESMFHRERDASKAALTPLVWQLEAWGFTLFDGQLPTAHLTSLGRALAARALPRALARALKRRPAAGAGSSTRR